jgi:hypothetical protein
MPDGTNLFDLALLPKKELLRMKQRLYDNCVLNGECWEKISDEIRLAKRGS